MATHGHTEWHVSRLRTLREQMHREDLVCPLLWITKGICEDVCPNKLLDLMNFAPSEWDSIVCALVIISRYVRVIRGSALFPVRPQSIGVSSFVGSVFRGVLLGEKSYDDALKAWRECRSAVTWTDGLEPNCPLLVRYYKAMAHIVDATWVMLTCLHRGINVDLVIATMLAQGRVVTKVHGLSVKDQSAIAAVRSLSLQICHYSELRPKGTTFLRLLSN